MAQILTGIVLFLFGALFTHAWSRYRNRLIQVRWSIQYFRVAAAGEDPRLGRIEVLYNGNPVQNVHTAVIDVENESNSDLENVVLTLGCLEGSTINMAYGYLIGGLQYLPFTNEYMKELMDVNAPEDVLRRREFRVPILNRGGRLSIVLLLSRADLLQPVVTVSCVHKGVKLKQEPPTPIFWGVATTDGLIVGWIVSAAVVLCLVLFAESIWLVGLVAWIAGLVVLAAGALLIRVWRMLGRFLS